MKYCLWCWNNRPPIFTCQTCMLAMPVHTEMPLQVVDSVLSWLLLQCRCVFLIVCIDMFWNSSSSGFENLSKLNIAREVSQYIPLFKKTKLYFKPINLPSHFSKNPNSDAVSKSTPLFHACFCLQTSHFCFQPVTYITFMKTARYLAFEGQQSQLVHLTNSISTPTSVWWYFALRIHKNVHHLFLCFC